MSSTHRANAHLPSPIHDLTATVRAPACALSDADGQIRATGMQGLFVSDLRVLTEATVRIDGHEPYSLARMPEGPGVSRFVAVADGFAESGPDPTVRVERLRRVHPDGMTEDILVSSTATRVVRASVTLDLRCDLTALDQAKAGRSGPDARADRTSDGLTWIGDSVTATVTTDAARVRTDPAHLAWDIELAPHQQISLHWTVRVSERIAVLVTPTALVEWERPRVSADDRRLVRLVDQAMDDLEALRLAEADDPAGTFLAAGAPWFLTLFGRDSLWAARMMLPLGTRLAETTLRTLARRQGTRTDPLSGEAPGKIMHELRHEDPRLGAATGIGATGRPAAYYGTIDATPLWISLLTDAWRWGLPADAVRELLPHLRRALSWLEHDADPDGDGFVEYIDRSGRGLANQGWKDSADAVRFHDGTLAQPSIALCEVQGYAHRAALDAAELLDTFGQVGEGDPWRAYAADLSERFRQRFWVSGPLGAFPALALDGTGRPVDSLTSNIGHLLGTGLLTRDEEATVARLIAAPALSSGYGLRTMSTVDEGFLPLSYHCGSVWPHDTAIVILGLVGTTATAAASSLVAGLLAAAEAFDYRLPELYGGDSRADLRRPVPYPGACRPQAWSAAAAVTVLQAGLGLTVDVPRGEVRVDPMPGLGAVSACGLSIAGAPVDIAVDRDGRVTMSALPAGLRWIQDSAEGAGLIDPDHRSGAPTSCR